jgi:hypothetical protein
MANRDPEPESSRRIVDQGAQGVNMDQLITLINELRGDLNSLRTDFRAHDHGNTASYVQAAITLRATANTFNGTAETSSAVAAAAAKAPL